MIFGTINIVRMNGSYLRLLKKYAALRFGENLRADFPDLMLNVNVREYLDGEEREEIFAKLNNESFLKEYAEHIDEFI